MGREAKFRKDLSMPGMVAEMRRCFEQRIEDGVSSRGVSLPDCLMSGLAIFALKYPSLLQFDRDARGLGEPSAREGNLRSLFGIGRAPSDSRMRERLDALDPEELRRPFKQARSDWQAPVRGAGASGAPGGGAGGAAGADPEDGRGEEERLRAEAR